MAGRPPLRIGQHGKISRIPLEPGAWVARCRYRDTDGVTRIVERRSPELDKHGKKAEDALLDALANRQAPGGGDVSLATKVTDLITQYIERNESEWADRTTDTYRYTAGKLAKLIGGLRVEDATPPRLDAALWSMQRAHGAGMSRHSRVLLEGGLQLAVMSSAIRTNPIRDVTRRRAKPAETKGAAPIDTQRLDELWMKLTKSDLCQRKDLIDPITLLLATGLRRAELLGLRWSDYDKNTGAVSVTGKLIRAKGQGLKRIDKAKTKAGKRVVVLPQFARTMLDARAKEDYRGDQKMIFPSTAGTWRDPDNFNGDWRKAREELGFPDVTSHSFRKTVATVIDEGGLSARVGADQLGHANVSLTQNVYMARGQVHAEVAELLEKAVVKTLNNGDEKTMDSASDEDAET